MAAVFEFVTMAFPKAGVLIGTVPVTLSTLLFAAVVVVYRKQLLCFFEQYRAFLPFYLLFCALALWILVYNKGNSAYYITITLVLIGSPLALGVGFASRPQAALRILAFSLFIVGLYAIIQWIFGIDRTSVQGVTLALGDAIDRKPIGYGFDGRDALKMPTTYQNGNEAGIFYLLALPVAMTWKPVAMEDRLIKTGGCVFGAAGLLLCGSRSAIVPFLVILPFLLLYMGRHMSYRAQLIFCAALFTAFLLGVAFAASSKGGVVAYAFQRYVLQTAQDPSASGRTNQYAVLYGTIHGLGNARYLQFLALGQPWSAATYVEGVLFVLDLFGLPAFLLFLAMLILPIVKLFRVSVPTALGLFAALFAFCIDNSYVYPPCLILFYYIAGLQLRIREPAGNEAPEPVPAVVTETRI